MASNDILEAKFRQLATFLSVSKLLQPEKSSRLSLDQLKVVYDLKIKHNDDGNKQFSQVVDFDEVEVFAFRQKMMKMEGDFLVIQPGNMRAENKIRSNLSQFLSPTPPRNGAGPAVKSDRKPKKIALDPKNFTFAAAILPLAYDKEVIFQALQHLKPSVLAVLNTNISANAQTSQLKIEGFEHFRQDVVQSHQVGGLAVYAHSRMNPVHLKQFEGQLFESIWLEVMTPEPITLYNNFAKPSFIIGHVMESKCQDYKKILRELLVSVLLENPNGNILIICQTKDLPWERSDSIVGFREEVIRPSSVGKQGFVVLKSGLFAEFGEGAFVNPLKPPSDTIDFLTISMRKHLCPCCDEAFLSSEAFKAHRETGRHRRNYFAYALHTERKSLVADKTDVTVTVVEPKSAELATYDAESGQIALKTKPGIRLVLKLKVENLRPREDQAVNASGEKIGVIVKSIELLAEERGFELKDNFSFCGSRQQRDPQCRAGIRINNGQCLPFEVHCTKPDIGQYRMPVFVHFVNEAAGDGALPVTIVREVLLRVTTADVDTIQPVEPYAKPKPAMKRMMLGSVEAGLPVDYGVPEGQPSLCKKWPLDPFAMPKSLKTLLAKGFKQYTEMKPDEMALLEQHRITLKSELSQAAYAQRFCLMLHCEEHQMSLDIRNYDMEEVTMKARGRMLELAVPGLAENRPSVLKGDKLYAQLVGSGHAPVKYEGFIHAVEDTSIVLGFSHKLMDMFVPNMKFNIAFTINRFPLRNMHRAVKFMGNAGPMRSLLFPTPDQAEESVKAKNLAFFSADIQRNEEQRQAVSWIAGGGIPGAPYVIFGPPGTGKTVTLSEAAKQVWKTRPGSRILATAPSNSAADLLAARLAKHIPKTQIVRFYAPSRLVSHVPADILEISNFHNSHSDISKAGLAKYRVVVVTLVTAGRIASAGFPPDHFTHVFIDEAGHATEPEAIIAVAGILSPARGQLVLAGDPKQLGPVLRSRIALNNGLQVSLLERLMASCEMYAKRPEFDARTITKLLKNFRSHESILALPSELFYDSELELAADPMIANSMLNWSKLPNKKWPVVFHAVVGDDKREGRSPSYFNAEEAAVVVQYVADLLDGKEKQVSKQVLAKEIGVISPYRRQAQKIRQLLQKKLQNKRKDWKDITVGSTEEFQGQERRIIVISTVRSKPHLLQSDYQHKLGFLNNSKRFNVAMTRAKALMIVVGNPFLLSLDPHWREFLRYVLRNGGNKGVGFAIPEDRGGERNDLRAKYELDEVEKKFREIGLEEKEEDDEDLNEISQTEYQQGPSWRSEH